MCAAGEALSTAEGLAEQYTKGPAAAVRAVKRVVVASSSGLSSEQALEAEHAIFTERWGSKENRDALSARKPKE